MMSLQDRIRQFRITAKARRDETYVPNSEWDRSARHWLVTLSRPDLGYPTLRRTLTVQYHTGSGLGPKPPKAVDVLSSLLSDASGIAYGETFENWAGDYGYDTDPITAMRLWEASRKQTEDLRNFLLDRDDPWELWLNRTEWQL